MDHDQRLKLLLEAFFAEFVRLALPGWVDRFDFDKVEWLPQEVFPNPPQGERRVVDLVARLPVRQPLTGAEQTMMTLVHVELESAESAAPLRKRMYDYRNFLQTKHGVPVLPMALFLRVGLEGVGWDVYEEWYWERRIVHFEYAYIGLPALDAFQHVQSDNLLASALAVLMRVPDDRRAELKVEAMQRAATSGQDAYRRHPLCECVEAYLPLEGPHLAEYSQLLLTPRYQEAKMIGQTSYEKGMQHGQLKLLQRQLEHRFGPLDESVLAKLTALPPDKLTDIGEQLLTAQSLQELGLED